MSFPLKLIPYVVAIALLIGAFFYVKNLGKIDCENKQKAVIIEGERTRDIIEHENKSLDHNTIVNRLDADGWLRGE